MEYLRHVEIRVSLDTNKHTYEESFGNVEAFARWWNEHVFLTLPEVTVDSEDFEHAPHHNED